MEKNVIYVAFHIGRLGKFRAPGHRTFLGEYNLRQLEEMNSERLMLVDTEWDEGENCEVPLPEKEWRLIDTGSNTILEGKEDIEALVGTLDFDTIYDTDYATTTDDLSEEETDTLYQAYIDGGYMSTELKDEICRMKGVKRIERLRVFPNKIEVQTQGGTEEIRLAGLYGKYTREEMKERLEEEGYCPVSVESLTDELGYIDFFRRGND